MQIIKFSDVHCYFLGGRKLGCLWDTNSPSSLNVYKSGLVLRFNVALTLLSSKYESTACTGKTEMRL